jgi:hypothetical protein
VQDDVDRQRNLCAAADADADVQCSRGATARRAVPSVHGQLAKVRPTSAISARRCALVSLPSVLRSWVGPLMLVDGEMEFDCRLADSPHTSFEMTCIVLHNKLYSFQGTRLDFNDTAADSVEPLD